MKNVLSLSDLINSTVIIYGAGATGRAVYNFIARKVHGANIIAFCDSFKTGFEANSGLRIISPDQLQDFQDATIIIAVSDILTEKAASEIKHTIRDAGVPDDRVISHSGFISMLSELDATEFDWQSYSDGLYNFDTNISLIEKMVSSLNKSNDFISVVDIGAGSMNVQRYLAENIRYYPVDYVKRSDETIVCDLNKLEFPDIHADVYVLCAMLYYISDPCWLLKKCASFAGKKIVIALNNKNLSKYPEVMHVYGLKSYLWFDEITSLLNKYGFFPETDITIDNIGRRFVIYSKT